MDEGWDYSHYNYELKHTPWYLYIKLNKYSLF